MSVAPDVDEFAAFVLGKAEECLARDGRVDPMAFVVRDDVVGVRDVGNFFTSPTARDVFATVM